jgi:hypothetical protein
LFNEEPNVCPKVVMLRQELMQHAQGAAASA